MALNQSGFQVRNMKLIWTECYSTLSNRQIVIICAMSKEQNCLLLLVAVISMVPLKRERPAVGLTVQQCNVPIVPKTCVSGQPISTVSRLYSKYSIVISTDEVV